MNLIRFKLVDDCYVHVPKEKVVAVVEQLDGSTSILMGNYVVLNVKAKHTVVAKRLREAE